MMRILPVTSIAAASLVLTGAALGQSSSLYVNPSGQTQAAARQPQNAGSQQARASQQPQTGGSAQTRGGQRQNQSQPPANRLPRRAPANPRPDTATGQEQAPHRLAPAIGRSSLSAVDVPKPRQFAVNDLVTIIIREESETDFQATLETEKSTEHTAEIAEFPRLTLSDLADLQLQPSDLDAGAPELDVSSDREFEGEGDYQRSEEMTGRITARIVDVKPNGTLALQAKKFVKSDGESLDVKLTGVCRAEDITADNTVLSTELYNLHLNKTHDGELKNATEKGLLTKILDFLFNF